MKHKIGYMILSVSTWVFVFSVIIYDLHQSHNIREENKRLKKEIIRYKNKHNRDSESLQDFLARMKELSVKYDAISKRNREEAKKYNINY